MSSETRNRLIKIIVDHYYSAAGKKLHVGKIADEAGISRQSLQRYYSDLVEYIKGNRNIDDLLPGHEPSAVTQLLLNAQKRATDLELSLQNIQKKHEAELIAVREHYITSLMQSDLISFDNSNINITLEKQSSLISSYTAQINELKTQLTNSTIKRTEYDLKSLNGSRIILDLDLKSANATYKKNKDYRSYSESKHEKIQSQFVKLNDLAGRNIHLIIFIDKFLCDLPYLLDRLPPNSSDEIVLRLPIFDTADLKNHLRKIPKSFRTSIYIPECRTIADAVAQRKFRASSTPLEELEHAEKADYVHLSKGVDRVIYFSVDNGK